MVIILPSPIGSWLRFTNHMSCVYGSGFPAVCGVCQSVLYVQVVWGEGGRGALVGSLVNAADVNVLGLL